MYIYICVCVCIIYVCMYVYVCLYVCICMYACKYWAGLKERDVNRILRHTLAKSFAIANHTHKMCQKGDNLC